MLSSILFAIIIYGIILQLPNCLKGLSMSLNQARLYIQKYQAALGNFAHWWIQMAWRGYCLEKSDPRCPEILQGDVTAQLPQVYNLAALWSQKQRIVERWERERWGKRKISWAGVLTAALETLSHSYVWGLLFIYSYFSPEHDLAK